MMQDHFQNQLPPPGVATDPSPAIWAVWVREHWGAVRVTGLDTTQLADVPGRVRVRAVIHLGSLSPADVHVDAVAGAADSADTTRPRLGELWSAQSFRNGTFVFEGFAEAEALGEQRLLTVRVRPRRAQETLADLSPVSQSSEVRVEPATRGG
jgi:hypothetical protein